ncbi:19160_t:CDS:1, partial [Funneliformis geosporum]
SRLMGKTKKLEGPCVIEICKRNSVTWRTVTDTVISRRQANKTLPYYIKENDIIYLNCYNAILINITSKFQQHVLERHPHIESEPEISSNEILSFSQAIRIITTILYERKRNLLPTIWTFKEFRLLIESNDK